MTKQLLCVFVLVLAACAAPSPATPERATAGLLAKYAELLRDQDASAIAAMFEPDGSLAHDDQPAIVGRAALEAFMTSFASYKVLAHDMQVTSAVARARTVAQSGTYAQSVRTPQGQTLRVVGSFIAVWRQQADGRWLIESMRTAPAPGR